MKTKSIRMKLISGTLFLIFLVSSFRLYSQNYLIQFAGAGASSQVDSVFIENLMQGTTLKMKGSEILRLNVLTGVERIPDDRQCDILLYPNPVGDKAKMQFYLPESGETMVSIYDITGKKIAERSDFLSAGKQTYGIYGAGKGIYLVRISSGRYVISNKFIGKGQADEGVRLEYEDTFIINRKEGDTKGITVEKEMAYTSGDRLKIMGVSDIYSTVLTIVPTEDKTVTFNFYGCTDGDGNNYPVVIIGTGKGAKGEPDPENKSGDYIVSGTNLKTKKYNNGNVIKHADDVDIWKNYAAYCYYGDNSGYAGNYGALYNWEAVATGRLCPVGWGVPGEYQWNNLIDGLGGEESAGGPLKETGSVFWTTQSSGTSNSTGFSARPGGRRYVSSSSYMGQSGYWWTSTTVTGYIYYLTMSDQNDGARVVRSYSYYEGFSVRCIMK